jgi:hypothetical protein
MHDYRASLWGQLPVLFVQRGYEWTGCLLNDWRPRFHVAEWRSADLPYECGLPRRLDLLEVDVDPVLHPGLCLTPS